MVETIRYSQIGKQDIRFGTGKFTVTLADGRVVTLDDVDVGAIADDPALSSAITRLILEGVTKANLRTPQTAGRLARVTDDVRGIWCDNGTQWFQCAPGGEMADVREFGAVGDNVADDTTAIQTAIDDAGTLKTILFPPGTYKTTAPILYRDGQRFLGVAGATIRLAGAGTFVINSVSPSAQVNNVHITGLRVELDTAVNATAGGINIEHVRAAFVSNVVISTVSQAQNSSSGTGLRVFEAPATGSSLYSRVSFVTIVGFATGARFENLNAVTADHIRQTQGTDGIHIIRTDAGIATQGGVYTGLIAESNTTSGVRLSGVTANSVTIAYVENDLGSTQVLIEDSGGFVARDNIVTIVGSAGSATLFADNSTDVNHILVASDNTGPSITQPIVIRSSSTTIEPLRIREVPGGGSTANVFVSVNPSEATEYFAISKTGQLRGFEGISGTGTFSNNLRGSCTFATAATCSVTFATAEPDATYFVAISGDANETFWVTGKGTGGFTLNSSNATSTAVVDWHLIR